MTEVKTTVPVKTTVWVDVDVREQTTDWLVGRMRNARRWGHKEVADTVERELIRRREARAEYRRAAPQLPEDFREMDDN